MDNEEMAEALSLAEDLVVEDAVKSFVEVLRGSFSQLDLAAERSVPYMDSDIPIVILNELGKKMPEIFGLDVLQKLIAAMRAQADLERQAFERATAIVDMYRVNG